MKMYMSDSALDVTDLKKGKKMKEKRYSYFISYQQSTELDIFMCLMWNGTFAFSVKKVI